MLLMILVAGTYVVAWWLVAHPAPVALSQPLR
jgi:hypothetical protein